MQIEKKDFSDAVLISVGETRIDAAIAIQFKDTVRELASGSTHRVVLDMSNVEFLDSSGLGALVAAMKHLGANRPLELAALSKNVKKVFQLTRMDKVFTLHDRVSDAIEEFADCS